MIVVTGAAGFIGSCMVAYLNEQGIEDLILVDDFSRSDKERNYADKSYHSLIDRQVFLSWLHSNAMPVEYIIHLGARTDTTEQSRQIFDELNLNYSKAIWNYCASRQVPLIYASSAATYGLGLKGYDDTLSPEDLKPLNPYGDSKNDFDKWALSQDLTPPFWAGLKFFNVYGPNEYHKGRMASVVFHAFNQIQQSGSMKLFRSHKEGIKDGHQSRDFIYVKDVINVIDFLRTNDLKSGLYNLGTGQARTFLDLVKATFTALGKPVSISFIDTPIDIRDNYQYFTEANMNSLVRVGYNRQFTTLEAGVEDYVINYLKSNKIL